MVLMVTFHSFRILFNYTISIGLKFIGTVGNFFFWTENCIYIETINISTGFTFKNIFFSAFYELNSTPPLRLSSRRVFLCGFSDRPTPQFLLFL